MKSFKRQAALSSTQNVSKYHEAVGLEKVLSRRALLNAEAFHLDGDDQRWGAKLLRLKNLKNIKKWGLQNPQNMSNNMQ